MAACVISTHVGIVIRSRGHHLASLIQLLAFGCWRGPQEAFSRRNLLNHAKKSWKPEDPKLLRFFETQWEITNIFIWTIFLKSFWGLLSGVPLGFNLWITELTFWPHKTLPDVFMLPPVCSVEHLGENTRTFTSCFIFQINCLLYRDMKLSLSWFMMENSNLDGAQSFCLCYSPLPGITLYFPRAVVLNLPNTATL